MILLFAFEIAGLIVGAILIISYSIWKPHHSSKVTKKEKKKLLSTHNFNISFGKIGFWDRLRLALNFDLEWIANTSSSGGYLRDDYKESIKNNTLAAFGSIGKNTTTHANGWWRFQLKINNVKEFALLSGRSPRNVKIDISRAKTTPLTITKPGERWVYDYKIEPNDTDGYDYKLVYNGRRELFPPLT